MTCDEFQILKSTKKGLNSKESYIVTRDKTSFLRILGADPSWEIMTATASEDHDRINVCQNQRRLIDSALQFGSELETNPTIETDLAGREYVKICSLTQRGSDEELNKDLYLNLSRFFEIYDSCSDIRERSRNEMSDLYVTLAIDDYGGDVYLGDGLWISSDGSLHDRGR